MSIDAAKFVMGSVSLDDAVAARLEEIEKKEQRTRRQNRDKGQKLGRIEDARQAMRAYLSRTEGVDVPGDFFRIVERRDEQGAFIYHFSYSGATESARKCTDVACSHVSLSALRQDGKRITWAAWHESNIPVPFSRFVPAVTYMRTGRT